MQYEIIERDTGFSLEGRYYNNLKEVQKALKEILIMIKKGETLYNSTKQFMNTEFVAFNKKKEVHFMGNKRVK